MRADLQGTDGSALLVASNDELRPFISEEDAFRWLLPFASDPVNLATLRRALAEEVSAIFVGRLSDHEVLRQIARIIARACVAVDLRTLPFTIPAGDPAAGAKEEWETPEDLVETAEEESEIEDKKPDPVIPPEFPRMAKREAAQVDLQAKIMGGLLDLLRFVGEKLLPTSKVGEALVALSNSHAIAVVEEAGDFGGAMAELAGNDGGRPEPSVVAATLQREAASTADSVVQAADRTGDVIAGLLAGEPQKTPEPSAVGTTMRDAAGAQGRDIQQKASDAAAVVDRMLTPGDAPRPTSSEVGPIYTAVAETQTRVLEQVAALDPAIDRLLTLPPDWQGPSLPPPPADEPPPRPSSRFQKPTFAAPPGEDTPDEPPDALLPGMTVVLSVETVNADPGTGVVFSVRRGARGHIADLIVPVPEPDADAAGPDAAGDADAAGPDAAGDAAAAGPEGAGPAATPDAPPVAVTLEWTVPDDLPVGEPVWFETRFRRGEAVGESPRLPVLDPFPFGDADTSAGPPPPSASPAPPPPAPPPSERVEATGPTPKLHAPRWIRPGDPRAPLGAIGAGPQPVGLLVDTPGVPDGTAVRFAVLADGGAEPVAVIEAVVEDARAVAEWQIPPGITGRLELRVEADGLAGPPTSGVPLQLLAPFPFGDAPTEAAPPPTPLAPPAESPSPPPTVLPTHRPRLHAPRWAPADDPRGRIDALEVGRPASVSLRVDAPDVPDGTPAVFTVVREGEPAPIATLETAVQDGAAAIEWTVAPTRTGAMRFTVAIEGHATPPAASGPLAVLPGFPFGDVPATNPDPNDGSR